MCQICLAVHLSGNEQKILAVTETLRKHLLSKRTEVVRRASGRQQHILRAEVSP